ncbi:MAG: cation:proton antiporter [Planctomycetota bacterium]
MFDNLDFSISGTPMHLNIVLVLGILVLGGTAAARICKVFHFPRVVGYVIVGILVGNSGLNLVPLEMVKSLKPFTMFALGIIGFMIGGELRYEVFKKYGRQFFIILFSQGLAAFFLVAITAALAGWFFTSQLRPAIAVALVLGAIASATAPAATANVLWEYKTKGPLTAAVLAIVALDDGLALLLYRAAATTAQAILGTGNGPFLTTTAILAGEIIGSVLLGLVTAVVLFYLLKIVKAEDIALTFTIAALLLVVGITMIPDIDPILPAMTFGITIANLAPRRSKTVFGLIDKFSPPIYIVFFVLAGAHMEFARLNAWLIAMVALYSLSRAAGKIFGAWFGAAYSKAPQTVRKFLGICLLPQAGVAIGLAILAGQQFNSESGHMIILIVMSGTFLMEVLGPPLVKLGVRYAGEIGLNITEEDLIKNLSVGDVMQKKPPTIPHDYSLKQILDVFSSTQDSYYPVVDSENKIVGDITIKGIKETMANQEFAGWLLACDIMDLPTDKTVPAESLEHILEKMTKLNIETIPVVQAIENDTLLGVLDARAVNRKISAEVLSKHQQADSL